MNSLENCVYNGFQSRILRKRYIDDASLSIEYILNFVNNIDPNIQFTYEATVSNSISFLDMYITLENQKFFTHLYIKELHSGSILPYESKSL